MPENIILRKKKLASILALSILIHGKSVIMKKIGRVFKTVKIWFVQRTF